jgi:hypothetical protein
LSALRPPPQINFRFPSRWNFAEILAVCSSPVSHPFSGKRYGCKAGRQSQLNFARHFVSYGTRAKLIRDPIFRDIRAAR